jgi:CHAT domain-containing protein
VIEQVKTSADLVTLSSCESAFGRRIAGEGLMSLARAFHLAGARSVVSTLWAIDDRASVDLMREFYRGLKQGLAKDEALRRAQLRFVNGPDEPRWRAPRYWAGFQLSGDWR